MSKDSQKTPTSSKLEQLKKDQAKFGTRAFVLVFEIILIFGFPAFLAVVTGQVLSDRFGGRSSPIYVLLAISFIASWFVLIKRARKIGLVLDEYHKKIEEEKKKLEVEREKEEGKDELLKPRKIKESNK
jgi:hypothetical protein